MPNWPLVLGRRTDWVYEVSSLVLPTSLSASSISSRTACERGGITGCCRRQLSTRSISGSSTLAWIAFRLSNICALSCTVAVSTVIHEVGPALVRRFDNTAFVDISNRDVLLFCSHDHRARRSRRVSVDGSDAFSPPLSLYRACAVALSQQNCRASVHTVSSLLCLYLS